MVKGAVVLSKDADSDFMAGLMTFVGGEIVAYTQMLEEARRIATECMEAEAELLNADAVINVRCSTAEVMNGAAEVPVHGTAVRYQ
mgnify:CR=1 FL=1